MIKYLEGLAGNRGLQLKEIKLLSARQKSKKSLEKLPRSESPDLDLQFSTKYRLELKRFSKICKIIGCKKVEAIT